MYDGSNENGNVLFSGSGYQSVPLLQAQGSAYIHFTSSGAGNGFSVTYTGRGYCSGQRSLGNLEDNFSDGSGTQPYQSNADCSWLIQPAWSDANPAGILLEFSSFTTNPLDFVRVFDGPSTTFPLLATYSGSNVPAPITSTQGSAMLVTFTSTGLTSDIGWNARYYGTFCLTLSELSNTYGTINDGSGSLNYRQNTNCLWFIHGSSNKSVHLSFNSFNTEVNKDFVRVYRGTSLTSKVLIWSFSGSSIPGQINSPLGESLFIEFVTDGTNHFSGWSASYSVVDPLGKIILLSTQFST